MRAPDQCDVCDKVNFLYERKAGAICMECLSLTYKIDKYHAMDKFIPLIEFMKACKEDRNG